MNKDKIYVIHFYELAPDDYPYILKTVVVRSEKSKDEVVGLIKEAYEAARKHYDEMYPFPSDFIDIFNFEIEKRGIHLVSVEDIWVEVK